MDLTRKYHLEIEVEKITMPELNKILESKKNIKDYLTHLCINVNISGIKNFLEKIEEDEKSKEIVKSLWNEMFCVLVQCTNSIENVHFFLGQNNFGLKAEMEYNNFKCLDKIIECANYVLFKDFYINHSKNYKQLNMAEKFDYFFKRLSDTMFFLNEKSMYEMGRFIILETDINIKKEHMDKLEFAEFEEQKDLFVLFNKRQLKEKLSNDVLNCGENVEKKLKL